MKGLSKKLKAKLATLLIVVITMMVGIPLDVHAEEMDVIPYETESSVEKPLVEKLLVEEGLIEDDSIEEALLQAIIFSYIVYIDTPLDDDVQTQKTGIANKDSDNNLEQDGLDEEILESILEALYQDMNQTSIFS